jgi:hypothetical protein
VTLTLFSQLVLFQQHPDHDQCPDIEVQHSDHFIFTHGHISFFLSFFFAVSLQTSHEPLLFGLNCWAFFTELSVLNAEAGTASRRKLSGKALLWVRVPNMILQKQHAPFFL